MSEIVLTYRSSPGALGANLAAIFFDLSGNLSYVGNDGVAKSVEVSGGNSVVANEAVSANFALASTITANVGAATMNTPSGRVKAGIGATSLVVTNSLVTANSKVMAWPAQSDATGRVTAVTPAAGNFTISLTAPTANMSVDFVVFGAA